MRNFAKFLDRQTDLVGLHLISLSALSRSHSNSRPDTLNTTPWYGSTSTHPFIWRPIWRKSSGKYTREKRINSTDKGMNNVENICIIYKNITAILATRWSWTTLWTLTKARVTSTALSSTSTPSRSTWCSSGTSSGSSETTSSRSLMFNFV